MTDRLDRTLLKRTFTFSEYYQLMEDLVARGETTGPNQSEVLVQYTRLNLQRTKRILKTLQLTPGIEERVRQIDSEMLWMVIVEAWCGDVPQNLPYLVALSELSDKVTLKVILRDENPEIMDQFLTNGSRSIPKMICLDPVTYRVAGTWGPRPAGARELVQALLQNPEVTKDMRSESVQRWYLQNKGLELQEELDRKISVWDQNLQKIDHDDLHTISN